METKSDFDRRLEQRHDELRWLYMELYDNADMFFELISRMRSFHEERKEELKKRDAERAGLRKETCWA